MKRIGYIIGLVIGIPIFILIVNFLFLSGNNPSETEVKGYIHRLTQDTIILPQSVKMQSEQYIIGLSRRGNPSGFLKKFTFYNNEYKKHFNLIFFRKLDTNSLMRLNVMQQNEGGDKISVHINQDQLNNPKYGTKENPVPVFPIDIILEPGQSSWEARGFPKDPFHVSEDLNKIFVEQYVKHFMPKEEFKEMFKK